jgi:hypothetical protein
VGTGTLIAGNDVNGTAAQKMGADRCLVIHGVFHRLVSVGYGGAEDGRVTLRSGRCLSAHT